MGLGHGKRMFNWGGGGLSRGDGVGSILTDSTLQARVWSRCIGHSRCVLQTKHRGASFVILSSLTPMFGGYDLNCHDSDSNPKISPAFKGLLNNLVDYNATWDINRTGQVTILHK